MGLIDCDIHHMLPSQAQIMPYLDERWRRYHERFGMRGLLETQYWVTTTHVAAARVDSFPPNGLMPGSDLPFLREQLLDEWGIDYGVLNVSEVFQFSAQKGDYGAALTRAINDWTLAEWLEPEPRLRSSIAATVDNVEAALGEIERHGEDPRFVQVLITLRNEAPMGDRRYWPIYRAAAERGLPIAVHVGGIAGHPPSGAGWHSFYFEMHTGHVQPYQAHAASLALNGVFDEIPELKIVFVEGGFSWMVPLSWRLDRLWGVLREEVPDLRRAPSEYLREHFWFTTQPIEEPDDEAQFEYMVEALGLEERLMFATDYPHWDFDAPDRALPRYLSAAAKAKIFNANARSLYDLPAAAEALA
ncbi:MAG: amidohydrolase [Actinobacteria bacterium]|nr:amidohydrolase [Actinomycetota bacterium]